MKLLFMRHGDPDYANDSLTPRGHVQAALLAEALASRPIDEIYVSPRGRAQMTARYTLDRRGETAITLDWLAELRGGYGEGRVAWDLHPVDLLREFGMPERLAWPGQVPYGQLWDQVLSPFYDAWDGFLAQRGYTREGPLYRVQTPCEATLAFFCHAGVTLSLLAPLLHLAPPLVYSHFGCDPSSVTVLESEEKGGYGTFRLVVLNDMSHAEHLRKSPREHDPYGF